MNAINNSVLQEPVVERYTVLGPVSVRRQRRSFMIYAALFVMGLLPAVMEASPAWQAAGLGLWFPGAGFFAVGGWALLLVPLSLVLFLLSIFGWFWAGATIAPVLAWVITIAGAGMMAGDTPITSYAHLLAAAFVAGIGVFWFYKRAQRQKRDLETARQRAELLPESLAEVRAAAAEVPDPETRELSADQLQSVRYVLDRALQPLNEWNGFTLGDQFQPGALRYQLNYSGYALGVVQGIYAPNFSGYLGQAQRNLIDKYRLPNVWGFWKYECIWGHLNFTNFDPCGKDNIMVTGWYAAQVGQYMLNSGDYQYQQEGSLTFRLNEKTAYTHNFQSVVGSITTNYDHYKDDYGMYACEPNWIYPICNFFGMMALASHDKVQGTEYVDQLMPMWIEKLDSEFTDASGSIMGLISEHTGFEFPYPVGDFGYAFYGNAFLPERAQRLWATSRKEMEEHLVTGDDGVEQLVLPGSVAFGEKGYKPYFANFYGHMLAVARELGDHRMAEAAQNSLDKQSGKVVEGGVLSYAGTDNMANATIAMARLLQTGDFRKSLIEGPGDDSLRGPLLASANYPQVLVAKALSKGDDLHLVLYPGGGNETQQELALERLAPSARYSVSSNRDAPAELVADSDGKASLTVSLSERTEIRIEPVADK